MPEICENCRASLDDYAHIPTWEGRKLCGECFIKTSFNPEAKLAQSGGRCERCGAGLNDVGAVFLLEGGVICLTCHETDRIANWHKNKLPDVPEACERCGRSFVGCDAAFLWLSQALCFECHEKASQTRPGLTEFEALPLVDFGPADVRQFPKWEPDDKSKSRN